MDPNPSSLEAPLDTPSLEPSQPAAPPPQSPQRGFKLPKRYLYVGLAAICLLGLFSVGALLLSHKKPAQEPPRQVTINTQTLDNGTLNKLTTTNTPTETKTQLTIAPDTLFKSNVNVQNSLQVGNGLEVKGATTLQGAVGINNNLAVRGSLSVGGSLSAPALNIGTLNTSSITTTSNISFGGHLIPTGSAPTVSAGKAALGGSVQISGTDTAGTVTISVGNGVGGTTIAGELATIHFNKSFPTTPKVQLTPINAESAALNYYAARSAGFFTINTGTNVTVGASYTFDYLVTQ